MKKPLKIFMGKWVRSFHIRIGADYDFMPENQEQRDALKRSIKIINDDVIEIKSIAHNIRIMALAFFLINFYFGVAEPYIERGRPIPPSIWSLFSPQGYAEWEQIRWEKKFNNGQPYSEPLRSESLKHNLNLAQKKRVKGFFFLIFLTAPLLVWLFLPMRGVRVDRRRQVIYSWRWGSLFCYQVTEPYLKDLEAYIAHSSAVTLQLKETSPLLYILPKAKQPHKGAQFPLGNRPVACLNQAIFIHNAVANFLYDEAGPQWFWELKNNEPYPKTMKDVVSAIGGFQPIKRGWPKHIDKRVDEYLASLPIDNDS